MPGALENPAADGTDRPTLLVVAAPAEWAAVVGGITGVAASAVHVPAASAAVAGRWRVEVLTGRVHAVLCGIGKSNAAAATAIALALDSYARVISIGIAGVLPGAAVELGSVVLATRSVYADEGLDDGATFRSCADLGFPLGPFAGSAVPADPGLAALLRPLAEHSAPICTVSTCSATDALAARVAARTGAAAEAMEGAAVGHVAARLGVPFAEMRVISNTTGERAGQRWDMASAMKRLHALAGAL